MAQITDHLMKKRIRQVIFMGCPTVKLRHKRDFSSNSSLEIFNSGHQDSSHTDLNDINPIRPGEGQLTRPDDQIHKYHSETSHPQIPKLCDLCAPLPGAKQIAQKVWPEKVKDAISGIFKHCSES